MGFFHILAMGIEVWTIKDGQLKTEEHTDKLLNYIRFWQNEGESKKTGMRVRDNQIELVKSGKFVGGKAPFGYRLIPSGMVSNHGRLLKKLEIVERHFLDAFIFAFLASRISWAFSQSCLLIMINSGICSREYIQSFRSSLV